MSTLFFCHALVLLSGLTCADLEQLVRTHQALVGELQLGEFAMGGEQLICGGAEALLMFRESFGYLSAPGSHSLQLSFEGLVVIRQ